MDLWKSENHKKRLGPQIAIPQSATFANPRRLEEEGGSQHPVNLRPLPGSGNKRSNEPDEIVVHVGGIPQRSRRHRPVNQRKL